MLSARNWAFWQGIASPHFGGFFWAVCISYCHSVPWKYHDVYLPACGLSPSVSSTLPQIQGFYQPHHPSVLQDSKRTHDLEDSQIQCKMRCYQVMTTDNMRHCNRIKFRRWKERKPTTHFPGLVDVFPLGDRRDGFDWLPPMRKTHTLCKLNWPHYTPTLIGMIGQV